MRTDLIKSVRILQLTSRGARWGRSAAYREAYGHDARTPQELVANLAYRYGGLGLMDILEKQSTMPDY